MGADLEKGSKHKTKWRLLKKEGQKAKLYRD